MELLYEHTLQKQAKAIGRLETDVAKMLGLMERMTVGDRQLVPAADGQITVPGGLVAQMMGGQNNLAIDNRQKNTVNVMINAFGCEQIGHITPEQIRDLLLEALRTNPTIPAAAQAAILKAAFIIYSDPAHPENVTCYIPNKKSDEALIHTLQPDGTMAWTLCPTSFVLEPLAKKSIDAIFDMQPFENADDFAPLMRELRDNEKRYAQGLELRPILIRNKDLLTRVLRALPASRH